MRRVLMAALLLAVVALPLMARAEPPETSQPKPAGNYYIKLACYDGDKVIIESELAVAEGFTAEIRSERWYYPGVAFSGLILIDAEKPRSKTASDDATAAAAVAILMPGNQLPDNIQSVDQVAPPAILDAAQHFSFAGLRFTVYCPGANRFEARVHWSKTAGREAFQLNSGEPMQFTDPPNSEWDYLGRLSVALHTPDLGVVDPGGYPQPQGRPAVPSNQ